MGHGITIYMQKFVKRIIVGSLKSNCYLVIDKNNQECLIIDPGDDADYIMRIIADEELKPTKIIATHGHFDHILAVTELKLAYNIPFLMHKKDEFLLDRMQSSAKMFTGFDSGPSPKVNQYLTGVTPVTIGENRFRIIETPGHSPGSVCLYDKMKNILFAGDLVFAGGGVGRTDFPYCSQKDLESSIAKLLKLPENTRVYCGHGESTSIGEIKSHLA